MEVMNFVTDSMIILIPALYSVGYVIKHTKYVKDKNIPAILMMIGILGAIGLGGVSVDSVVQGILVAGATVLGNETVKQFKREE